MPRCSVIIPVHNKASLTRQCLNRLLPRVADAEDFEIVVVDDASSDLTPRLLAAYGDRIRVVTHDTNRGFARSCNDGASAASGDYLVFLNNDTVPLDDWLDALVGYADTHPKAAVVGSKLLFPDGTVQHAGMVICQDRYPRHIYMGFPGEHPAVNRSRRYQIVTGACALIRRERFWEVGGFDTTYQNSYEDVELCLRLGKLGYEVHYCHESVLYHLESATREGRSREFEFSTAQYRQRWWHRVQPDDLQYYADDGLLHVGYRELYPVLMAISPQLAVVEPDERERQADALLNARARQVFDLLRQNIRLAVQAQEAELAAAARPANGAAAQPPNGSAMPAPPSPASQSPTAPALAPQPLTTPALGPQALAPIVEPTLVARGAVHTLGQPASGRLISIVLPVKNGATHLRELLPHVLRQEIDAEVEFVAVDSGSADDSVDVLRRHAATVLAIAPAEFNHGLTRTLAARYARGAVLVFLTQSALPADERWLANLVAPLAADSALAGVCSRVLPRADADPLRRLDGLRDPSAAAERRVIEIADWDEYRALSPDALRRFVNFHTVSAAVRPEILARFPFRAVASIGEDTLWAKDVLEAGYKLQHEPTSVVLHSHNYSWLETFQRNVDDGAANRAIVGRQLDAANVFPSVQELVREDWRYLEHEAGLDPAALDEWRLRAALQRAAQVLGQWIGGNQAASAQDPAGLLSLTEQIKTGASTAPGAAGPESGPRHGD